MFSQSVTSMCVFKYSNGCCLPVLLTYIFQHFCSLANLYAHCTILQVDQGLGIGSKFPFFNRHQLTLTQFFQLKQVEEGAGKPPPPVLVLHGHYGGCVGDLPSYDAFTLGGPYSVRGYNMGEIGAARNILEVRISEENRIKSSCFKWEKRWIISRFQTYKDMLFITLNNVDCGYAS